MKKITTIGLLVTLFILGSLEANSQVKSSVKQTVTFGINRSAKRTQSLLASSQNSAKVTVSKTSANKTLLTVTE
jgi:hypothetical protein